MFSHWHQKFRKIEDTKTKEQIADKLYKDRYLSSYLAQWLTKLHKKLKIKHLNELKSKYEKRHTRRKFLQKWLVAFEKSRYLGEQEQAINHHKTNMILLKFFQSFKRQVQLQMRKKVFNEAARQQYMHQFGKRAFSNWRQGLANAQDQKELYVYLEEDVNQKTKSKVIKSLKMYTDYKIQKRLNDLILTRDIQAIQKRRYLKNWMDQVNKIYGASML